MADNKSRNLFGRNGEESDVSSVFDSWNGAPDAEQPPGGLAGGHTGQERADHHIAPLSTSESTPAAEAEAAGLRHWSEPPQGGVGARSSSSGVRGPTWRGEDPNWSGDELSDVFGEGISFGTHRTTNRDVAPVPGGDPDRVVGRRLEVGQYQNEPKTAAVPQAATPHVEDVSPLDQRFNAADTRPPPVGRQRSVTQSTLLASQPQTQPQPQAQAPEMVAGGRPISPVSNHIDPVGMAPSPDEFSVAFEHPPAHDPSISGDHMGHADPGASAGMAQKPASGLSERVGVGVALVVLVLGASAFGPVPALVLLCGAVLVAAIEVFGAMRQAGLRPATLLGIVGAVALPAAVYVRGEAAYPLVIALTVVFGMLWYLAGADDERPVLNLGITIMAMLWVGGLAGFAALLLPLEGGVGLVLSAIAVTAASDSFAYFGGKTYGSRPFHPASPNKTWEGTLTGFCGAVMMGMVLGLSGFVSAFDGRVTAAIVFSAVVGVLAVVGDLSESLIKRDLGVKDMGTILPGHGGVLDRIDALLFTLPGAYYVAVFFQLV